MKPKERIESVMEYRADTHSYQLVTTIPEALVESGLVEKIQQSIVDRMVEDLMAEAIADVAVEVDVKLLVRRLIIAMANKLQGT